MSVSDDSGISKINIYARTKMLIDSVRHERREISDRMKKINDWFVKVVASCLIYIKFDSLQLVLVNVLPLFVLLLPMLLKGYMRFVTVVRSWERPDPAG
jgi:hypothetical protein